jgi:hypothetical protein
VIKSEARIAVDQLEPCPNAASVHATGTDASPGSGELLSLMKQLRDELSAFLADVEAGRDFSGNRD